MLEALICMLLEVHPGTRREFSELHDAQKHATYDAKLVEAKRGCPCAPRTLEMQNAHLATKRARAELPTIQRG